MDESSGVADAETGVEKYGLESSGGKEDPDEQSWGYFYDIKTKMSFSFELFLHISLKMPLPTPSLYCSSSFVE